MDFYKWLLDETKRVKKLPSQPSSKKTAPIAHADVDRWLKSVDGLAKDLTALKDAKLKAKGKMDQIGKSKPEDRVEKDKDVEKDEKSGKAERTQPKGDKEILSLPEPKITKTDRQSRRADAEDSTDVKRVIEDKPTQRSTKVKRVDAEEDRQ